MFDWLPSWRWLPVLLIYLVAGLVRATQNEGSHPDFNPFSRENWEATVPNLLVSAAKLYVATYVVTLLFPDDYPNYLVQFLWLARKISYLGLPLILGGVLALVALHALADFIYDLSRPLLIASALTIRQLASFVELAGLAVLLVNFLYVVVMALQFMWRERPDWLPTWLLWLQILTSVLVAPYSLIGFAVVVRLGLGAGLIFLQNNWTLLRVSSVYLFPDRHMFANSHPQSENFPADAQVARQANPAETRLLFLSDLHVAPVGKSVMFSAIGSEPTLGRVTDFVQQTLPTALVLVGDITDTGHSQAWGCVASAVSQVSIPIYAIPGNHDVHFAQYNDHDAKPSYTPAEIEKRLECVVNCDDARGSLPKVVRVAGTNVLLLLLDSNGRESDGPVTNALGLVGPVQLRQTEDRLRAARCEGDVVIAVLHHHLLLPSGGPGIWYLRCLDSLAVLKFAERNNVAAIVNGHLHMPFVARYRPRDQTSRPPKEILIISCGSLHHHAEGPLAKQIKLPSAYLLTVTIEGSIFVTLIKDAMPGAAPEEKHPGPAESNDRSLSSP